MRCIRNSLDAYVIKFIAVYGIFWGHYFEAVGWKCFESRGPPSNIIFPFQRTVHWCGWELALQLCVCLLPSLELKWEWKCPLVSNLHSIQRGFYKIRLLTSPA